MLFRLNRTKTLLVLSATKPGFVLPIFMGVFYTFQNVNWGQNGVKLDVQSPLFAEKVRKAPDFEMKSGAFMVAEAGLEPTTSGL